tara:strand:+ start:98945 stop:99811 length:867 start_codon:yes stop_codon:yes gene_type:complete
MAENFYNDIGAAGGTGTPADADTYTGLLSQWSLFADTTTTQFDSNGGGFGVGDAFNDAGDAFMVSGLAAPGGSPSANTFDNEGVGSGNNGQLTAHWTNISGVVTSLIGDATGSNVTQGYSGGVIDFYYNDSVTYNFGNGVGFQPDVASLGTADNSGFTDGTLVLSINLLGGTGDSRFDLAGNYLTGSFKLDFEVTTALDNFWYFQDGTDFNDLVAQLLRINTSIDANTDNVVQTACTVDQQCLFTVDSDHDGSIVFDRAVPLPGTLALFGLGLLGLGGMVRRNKKLAA